MTEDPNQFSREAWDANAEVWDSRMGDEGNDFFRILQWPVIVSFLDLQPGQRLLRDGLRLLRKSGRKIQSP